MRYVDVKPPRRTVGTCYPSVRAEALGNSAESEEVGPGGVHLWLSDFSGSDFIGSTWISTFVMSGSSERMTF